VLLGDVADRDANWVRGNFAIIDILLLSAVWVVGAVFANWNAPVLDGNHDHQGDGNS
jgi:hypothetical protein